MSPPKRSSSTTRLFSGAARQARCCAAFGKPATGWCYLNAVRRCPTPTPNDRPTRSAAARTRVLARWFLLGVPFGVYCSTDSSHAVHPSNPIKYTSLLDPGNPIHPTEELRTQKKKGSHYLARPHKDWRLISGNFAKAQNTARETRSA